MSQANTGHWSQTDLLVCLRSSATDCAASQTLADPEDGSGFTGFGVVSQTVEPGEEDGIGGESFVGVEI